MVDRVLAFPEGTRNMLPAPVVRGRKGEHAGIMEGMRAQGCVHAAIGAHATSHTGGYLKPLLERATPS
jgi:excinuclease UvrABC ATPase subunit